MFIHFFIKHERKYKNRTGKKKKNRVHNVVIDDCLSRMLASYKCCSFSTKLRVYILGLPCRKLDIVRKVIDSHLSEDRIPGRIAILVRDLIRFRTPPSSNARDMHVEKRKFINILFHSKGMDMVNLPSLLQNKNVVSAIPPNVNNTPPIVSYKYTNTLIR